MKVIKMAAIALAATALVACSGKKETSQKYEDKIVEERTAELQVLSGASVTGDDADYFSISGPNGSQTVTLTGTPDKEHSNEFNGEGDLSITVDITITKAYPEAIHDVNRHDFVIEVLDASNEKVTELYMSDVDADNLLAELKKPAPGTVSITYTGSASDESYYEIFEKAKTIRLTKAEVFTEAQYKGSGSSSSDDEGVAGDDSYDSSDDAEESVSSSSSSSNEWDSILDDFDSYVSKMASAIHKSNSGNASADLDYVAAQAEAASILIKLNRAKSEMTSAQQKRFSSILAKYNKALTSHK